jgi:hypothetical protein
MIQRVKEGIHFVEGLEILHEGNFQQIEELQDAYEHSNDLVYVADPYTGGPGAPWMPAGNHLIFKAKSVTKLGTGEEVSEFGGWCKLYSAPKGKGHILVALGND